MENDMILTDVKITSRFSKSLKGIGCYATGLLGNKTVTTTAIVQLILPNDKNDLYQIKTFRGSVYSLVNVSNSGIELIRSMLET